MQAKTANHKPPKMPNEMWQKVFDYLNPKDLKSVRLCWRVWTDNGSRALFETIVFRHDIDSFQSFENIVSKPELKAGIKSLQFEIGFRSFFDMLRHLLAAHTYISYHSSYLEDAEAVIEAAIKELSSWYTGFHLAKQNYRKNSLLVAAFKQLETLERIDVTYRTPPFRNRLLVEAYIEGSDVDTSDIARKEFKAMLLALQRSNTKLKHFSHDRPPIAVFASYGHFQIDLEELSPLRLLQTLHLTFHAIDAPHFAFRHGLARFLRASPGLKDLRFGFTPRDPDAAMDEGPWILANSNEELQKWYVPLWKIIGLYRWKSLVKLRLDGLLVCEIGLRDFITRHAETLR